MAKPFVAGNWKMNTSISEAIKLARALRPALSGIDGVTRVICPPFISLAGVSAEFVGSDIKVGAQNMHSEPKGAFTGEIAGAMLKDVCDYVILGHSERRQLLGEQDDFINAKVRAALEIGLTPILCVGETLDQREAGNAGTVVEGQLQGGLRDVSAEDIGRSVVAYEPVWAIGTGRAATPEMAQEMMGLIRYEVARLSHIEIAGNVPLLYGGSVNAENAAELAEQRDLDGALVGGASLKADDFAAIAKAFATRA
ncbi:MAG: triose-phosphate isomerase [Chloroflexi bacterium]|nr:triose-phosphate isomerase [Chloroflexota bacterium]